MSKTIIYYAEVIESDGDDSYWNEGRKVIEPFSFIGAVPDRGNKTEFCCDTLEESTSGGNSWKSGIEVFHIFAGGPDLRPVGIYAREDGSHRYPFKVCPFCASPIEAVKNLSLRSIRSNPKTVWETHVEVIQ